MPELSRFAGIVIYMLFCETRSNTINRTCMCTTESARRLLAWTANC